MQKITLLSLFGLLAVSIANAALLDSTLPPDYAVILSRQAPGTPQYECHSNCGNALAGGRDPAHCTNATWTGYYEACLDCALDFDIWRIYGTGVGSAASACGLSATPSSDSGSGPAASSSVAPTTETSAAITTPPPPPPPPTPTPSATDADTAGSVVSSATTSVSTAGAASGPAASAPGSVSSCVGMLVAGLAGLMGLL